MRQWGVFDQAQVNLTGRPVFAVVTGETGAGKSVLMNALEYLCFASTKRSLFRPGSETSVALRKGGQDVRRSYNAATRRSLCEINGQKTTAKSLAEQMAGSVRFWSADENRLREHSGGFPVSNKEGQDTTTRLGFFAYIDTFLGGPEMLEQTRTAYVEWLASHQDLQRLLSLQRRVIQGNEAELLTHFSSELDALEGRLRKLTIELLHTVQDLDCQELDSCQIPKVSGQEDVDQLDKEEGGEQDETKRPTAFVPAHLSATPVADLMQTLADVTTNTAAVLQPLDLRKCWKALLLADRVFNGLARATSAAFPPSTHAQNIQQNSRRAAATFDISDMRQLDAVDKSLEEYSERLLSLQTGLRSLGLYSSSQLEARMEGAHLALQVASKSLREASQKMYAVQSTLPDVSGVLGRLVVVRAEWESLARKHGGISPPELHRLRCEWKEDITSLATMRADLPLAHSREYAAKKRYCAVAEALSARRRDAASLLASRVNALLPSLEMADKLLLVDLRNATDIPDDLLEPTSSRVTAMGWDEVRLSIARRGLEGAVPLPEDECLAPLSTLSSGETARLSLALETCCLDGHGDLEGAGPMARDSLVVYDEIDAHIGGEAAVAVARLLRSQGRRWQVVAITHNPVIAAAGDVHFVVRRHASTKSTVVQVEGELREAELARMATGRLDTSAGTALARALLSAFT